MASLAAKELELVNKVELRIALADSDAKLEAILKTFLTPLLLKLASGHVSVRNKVIAICQHINTRIKPPTIKLPVAALLKQFKDHPAVPLIRHFDLLYVQQGIDRLPASERIELVPILIHGLSEDSSKSATHGSSLFNVLLRSLPLFPLPQRGTKEDGELRETLGLTEREVDAKFLAVWFGKAILLSITRPGDQTAASMSIQRCPGLSPDEYSFLTLGGKPETWVQSEHGGMNLVSTKIAIVRFMASGAFIDEERFLPALFASADPNSRISDIGDDLLKRTLPNIPLENSSLIEQLYHIYFGTPDVTGTLPVKLGLQTKILGLLSKSVIATSFTSQIMRLVEDGIIPSSNADEVVGPMPAATPGLEASKLRGSVFSFINWVARMGSPKDLQVVAPALVSKLRDYVEHQGWPSPSNEGVRSAAEMSLRGYAYESIGLLAKACPEGLLLDANLDLLRWLFRSLSEEGSGENIFVSVEESISSVMGAFTDATDSDITEGLRSLLLQYVQLQVGDDSPSGDNSKVRRSTRLVAVRFANRCLAYGDVTGRWIDLLATGGRQDERDDVVEQGKKGLDPHWYRMLNPVQGSPQASATYGRYIFPDISELVRYIFGGPTEEETGPRGASRLVSMKDQQASVLAPAIGFCRRVLLTQALQQAGAAPTVDVEWEQKLDSLISGDEAARKIVREFLKRMMNADSGHDSHAIQHFLNVTFDGLLWNHGQGLDRCSDYFVELSSLSPDGLVRSLAGRAPELTRAIHSNNAKTRLTAAHAFGILASHDAYPSDALQGLVVPFLKMSEAWETVIGAESNKAHGSILALSYLFARLAFRHRLEAIPDATLSRFKSVVFSILLESKDASLQEAAFLAIDQLSIFSVLSSGSLSVTHTTESIIEELAKSAKAGKEKACIALGRFAMIFEENNPETARLRSIILDHIYKLHELRQPEIHFSVGEALSCIAAGWSSKILLVELDVEGEIPETTTPSHALSEILGRILKDSSSSKPALRKACCVWLLCLVQYCGHLPQVQERLRQSQVAFKGFFSDRDELVQEAASRGLSLVYEKGDKAIKDDLIRDLVSSFTGNTAGLAGKVTDETELFEPGTLPTGEGKGVTTYKDIMSLAAEVGDPSLVYRFMSLASSSAVWSSRAAFGRYGLRSILSDSSVDGYLAGNPKLYSKLFRYRFDPNPTVQKSMNDIWAALVKDSSSTIDKYFDSIMEDLLKSIIGKEWRVREASCAAIADLVQGRPFSKYEKYLNDIWNLSFKVLDDIKDSVRTAAMGLCRVLTASLVRSVESLSTSSWDSNKMLDNVMPFLLSSSGLEASAQEVRLFALDTVLKLVKSAGSTLRPYIPDLVARLLGLLSTLEPETINYLHLNASKYNLTEEKIDAVRLSSIRSSPMMEAIEKCLELLDEKGMSELVPTLQTAIKQSVGMPSKIGCSRVLVTLSTRHNFLFRPHADSFIKTIEKSVLDRNDTVSSSYATATGYLCRVASDDQILRLAQFCKELYFSGEDEKKRSVSGDIAYSISKYATDRFSHLAVDFLPFIFIAKHDSDEHTREYFEKTWSENVGGVRAVLLYFNEILSLGISYLESPRWVVKHASALAVADVIVSAGAELSFSNAEKVFPALEKAIGGKTWDGKEKVLEAVVLFAKTGSSLWKQKSDIACQITKIVLREAKRNNPAYQQHALKQLGLYTETMDDVDLFPEVYSIVASTVESNLGESSRMDIDSQDGNHSSKTLQELAIVNGMGAIFRSLNLNHAKGLELSSRLEKVLTITQKASTLGTTAVQTATVDGIKIILDKMDAAGSSAVLPESHSDELLLGILKGIGSLGDGAEAIRTKRADAIEALVKLLGKCYKGQTPTKLLSLVQGEVGTAIAKERSVSVRRVLQRVVQLLEQLQQESG